MNTNITVVNSNTFQRDIKAYYIGSASVFTNNQTDELAYKNWLWGKIKDPNSAQHKKVISIVNDIRKNNYNQVQFITLEKEYHGEIVKKLFLWWMENVK